MDERYVIRRCRLHPANAAPRRVGRGEIGGVASERGGQELLEGLIQRIPNPVEFGLIAPVQEQIETRAPFMVGREGGIIAENVRTVSDQGTGVGKVRKLR